MPLYVRCLVPDYADDDFRSGSYSPWFIGHEDQSKLQDEVLIQAYKDFLLDADDIPDGEEMDQFHSHLEDQGYVALNSTVEGWCVIPVGDE